MPPLARRSRRPVTATVVVAGASHPRDTAKLIGRANIAAGRGHAVTAGVTRAREIADAGRTRRFARARCPVGTAVTTLS